MCKDTAKGPTGVPTTALRNAAEQMRTAAAEIPDPRRRKKAPHPFPEIVVMAVTAVVCGANQWTEVEEICQGIESWLRGFLTLPSGVPSHDTFGRVFRLLKPELLARLMRDWTQRVCEAPGLLGEGNALRPQIAIDGKCNRRSHDRATGKEALHMVSAYATQTGLVLACLDVGTKSNEIPTVPDVLEQLELSETVVTMDAMGCQTDTAQLIVDKEADYVLALKGNQGGTHEEVKALFAELEGREREFDDVTVTHCRMEENGHGRQETREYFLATNIGGFRSGEKWPRFHGAIKVRSTRRERGQTSTEDRYYITSLRRGVRTVAKYVRGHWGIENGLHWRLDISFREDESRIRKGHGPANFAILCRFAFNLLKSETTLKRGMNAKRLRALLNPEYRNRVLFQT